MKTVLKIAVISAILVILLSFLRGADYLALAAAAAAIHEIGHILAAWALKIPKCASSTSFFGLSLKYDFSSASYGAEVAVSSAGALFNIRACAVTFCAAPHPGTHAIFFIFSNLSLALFNLLPVSPLDGSGILRALLLMVASDRTAERIVSIVSSLISAAFFVFCIYVQLKIGANLSLMFISIFLIYNTIKNAKTIMKE